MKRAIVHVDRLQLAGFAPEDVRAAATGLRAAMASSFRAAAEEGGDLAPASRDQLRLGRFELPAGAGAFEIGVRAGRRIGRGLGR